jgi:hypothetical protein
MSWRLCVDGKKSTGGQNSAEFEQKAQREFCTVARVAGTAPFQSNGNRLRRRVYGLEVGMPELHVDFDGGCLFQRKQWEFTLFRATPADSILFRGSKLLGVHTETLRRWERDGKIKPRRTSGNRRRYDIAEIRPDLIHAAPQASRQNVAYARV